MSEKKFTFKTSRGGGGPRSYTKKEKDLTASELYLLLGDFVDQFNKLPEMTKMMFMQYLTRALQDKQIEKLENDLQKGETGNNSSTESEDTIPDQDQSLEGIHSDSGLSGQRKESEV